MKCVYSRFPRPPKNTFRDNTTACACDNLPVVICSSNLQSCICTGFSTCSFFTRQGPAYVSATPCLAHAYCSMNTSMFYSLPLIIVCSAAEVSNPALSTRQWQNICNNKYIRLSCVFDTAVPFDHQSTPPKPTIISTHVMDRQCMHFKQHAAPMLTGRGQ